jgi:hypothetical protein
MASGLAVLVISLVGTPAGWLRVGRASGAAMGVAAAGELRIGRVGLMAGLVSRGIAISLAAIVVVGGEVVLATRAARAARVVRVVRTVGATGVNGATKGAGPDIGRGEAGNRAVGGQPMHGAGSSRSGRGSGLRGLRSSLSGGCRSPSAVRSGLSQRRGDRGGGSPAGSDSAKGAGCPSSAAIHRASGTRSADGTVRPGDVRRHGVRSRGGARGALRRNGGDARAEGIRPGAARGACGRGIGGGAWGPCGVEGAASARDANRRSSPRREGAGEDGGRGADRATDRARVAAQTGRWPYRAGQAP